MSVSVDLVRKTTEHSKCLHFLRMSPSAASVRESEVFCASRCLQVSSPQACLDRAHLLALEQPRAGGTSEVVGRGEGEALTLRRGSAQPGASPFPCRAGLVKSPLLLSFQGLFSVGANRLEAEKREKRRLAIQLSKNRGSGGTREREGAVISHPGNTASALVSRA